MPRYSEEIQRELDQRYLLFAEELVAHGGWEAGTIRKVAGAARISRGPVHTRFKGLGLKKALVDQAYMNVLTALFGQDEEPVDIAEILEAVVRYLRRDKEAAPLMVQVAGLMASRRAPGGEELYDQIIRARVRTAKFIESLLDDKLSTYRPGRRMTAEAIVKWYEVACMTLVMHVASDRDLIALANGVRALA